MTEQPPHPGWSPQQPPGAGGGAPTPAPNAAPGWSSPTAPAGPAGPAPVAQPAYPAYPGYPGAGPGAGGYGPSSWNRPQAPKPGVVPLRPLGLSEILDGAFTYIRRSPGLVLGIAAVVAVISNIVQFIFSLNLFTSSSSSSVLLDQSASAGDLTPILGQLIGGSLLTAFVIVLFQVIATGLLTIVITRAVLGQDIGWSEAWARTRGLILPLIGLTLLTGFLSLFGLVFFIVPGVFLYVSWAIAVPALMVERCGVIEAMRRSWRLVRGSRWRVFGILVLSQIIAGFVAQIVAVPFAIIGVTIDGFSGGLAGGTVPLATLIASAIGGVIATTITLPFTAGVVALLYVDQRMRREGLDLQLAQASAASSTPTASPSASATPPAASPWTSGPPTP